MSILIYEPFPENTEAGKKFKTGYDDFVQKQHLPDVFWDPVDERWETYATSTFTRVGLPRVMPGSSYWEERSMLVEVLNLSRASRILNTQVIWNPRDGFWYQWRSAAPKPPPPPPPPPPPSWLVRLMSDLEALEGAKNLSPEERHLARAGLIQRAFGAAR
jgi:hypothetical protein